MTPDPLDPEQLAAFRELDGLRRIRDLARKGCGCDGSCQADDAITTGLDLEDIE
jgi:hypothetical protein